MVTGALIVGEVCGEVSKVAVSPGLTGAFVEVYARFVQFAAVFQLLACSVADRAADPHSIDGESRSGGDGKKKRKIKRAHGGKYN